MNAVFLPVFGQHLWSAIVFAGVTAASIAGYEMTSKRMAEAKRARIRVKARTPKRPRR